MFVSYLLHDGPESGGHGGHGVADRTAVVAAGGAASGVGGGGGRGAGDHAPGGGEAGARSAGRSGGAAQGAGSEDGGGGAVGDGSGGSGGPALADGGGRHGLGGGAGADGDEALLDLALLGVAVGAGGVGDLDEGAVGVDVGVGAGDLVAVAVLLLGDVGLLELVGHLVAEVVLGVGLKKRGRSLSQFDLGNFFLFALTSNISPFSSMMTWGAAAAVATRAAEKRAAFKKMKRSKVNIHCWQRQM